jgi:hypothetical protein
MFPEYAAGISDHCPNASITFFGFVIGPFLGVLELLIGGVLDCCHPVICAFERNDKL